MPKINLVIADCDEAYIEGLENYISHYCRERFQLTCFTKAECLEQYLTNSGNSIDILLVSPELLCEKLLSKINTVILLTDGRILDECISYKMLNKYQTGERIAARIIDIYAENNPHEVHTDIENRKTRIIGVFSPNGGAGKTTIAIAAALRCVQRGKKVFYLNLEEIPSTSLFFDCETEQNLSHVFYFLKEKSKNLSLKIEGTRITDFQSGIHYFSPPENVMELGEILPEEIELLINQIKLLNYYDLIFIDMPSAINGRNVKVFEASDVILFILTQQETCPIKSENVIRYLDMAGIKINDKLSFVTNKYDGSISCGVGNNLLRQQDISIKIPQGTDIFTTVDGRRVFDLNNDFGEAVNNLVNSIIENQKVNSYGNQY